MEQIPLGKAAAKPVTIEDKYTSTTNASNYLVQSSPMHDYFKESGYWKEMAKYRKKVPRSLRPVVALVVRGWHGLLVTPRLMHSLYDYHGELCV